MEEKYYSPRELANRYNVTPQAIIKWIKQGRLKAIKLGSVWRIPESALEEFLKQKQVP
jgi:excisionase family DNA binding protein